MKKASPYPLAPPPQKRSAQPAAEDSDDTPKILKHPIGMDSSAAPLGASSSAATATKAARGLLNSAERRSQKIAQQKAGAKKKDENGFGSGQMAGSDAENLQLPPFVQQAGAKSDERSILVVDSHDTEPFSGLAGG